MIRECDNPSVALSWKLTKPPQQPLQAMKCHGEKLQFGCSYKPLFKTSLSGKTHHRPLQCWVGGNVSDYGFPVLFLQHEVAGLQSTFILAPWVLHTELLFLSEAILGSFFFLFQLYTKKQSSVVEIVLLNQPSSLDSRLAFTSIIKKSDFPR